MSTEAETEHLIDTIRAGVIGRSEAMVGPFGEKPVIYADYLGEPGSEKAHHLLHTNYEAREPRGIR